MEDYRSAFLQRSKDVKILHESERRTAAMHLGGVVIECLLKYILYLCMPPNHDGNKEWYTGEENSKHTITNPGHDYQKALEHARRYNPHLRKRVQDFPQMRTWLQEVEAPNGHFINMRYRSAEPDARNYQQWYTAYNRLKGWLEKEIELKPKEGNL